MTAPVPETAAPEGRRAGRLGWRRVIFGGLLGLLGGAGVVHLVGGTMSLLIAGGSAAAGVAGYSVYKYPDWRRRYWGPWSARKREGKGQKGFSEAWQRNWRKTKTWKTPGSPFRGRHGRTGTRPGGLGARMRNRGTGTVFRRRAGAGTGRGRSALRSPGHNRRARAGSGSRSRAFRRSGAGTGRRAGIFRRSGRGSGASRRPSPAFRRFRRSSGSAPRSRRRTGAGGSAPRASRRRLFRPSTWRRRPAGPGGGRPRIPRSGRTRRRTPFHPFGGRRTTPRTPPAGRTRRRTPFHPFGGRRTAPRTPPGGRTRPRSFRHPFGGRRGPGTPPRRLARIRSRVARTRPGRAARHGWTRLFGTPASPRSGRRAWHRVFGTPAQRRIRRRAARARRANARNRRRRMAGTYGRRRRWYAPWRRPGSVSLRHRAGNWLGNWRVRRLRYKGLLRGTGRTPLRLRFRHWRAKMRGWSFRRWRQNRRRNRRMPRPLLSGRHRAGSQSAALHRFGRTRLGQWIMRRDRRRRQQWASRQRPGRPVPVPSAPRPGASPAAGGNGRRAAGQAGNGNRTEGKKLSHVEAAAEALEEATSWEASDPQDVHDTIAAVPRIPEGAYGVLDNVASRLEEHPNIDPAMVEAIREAAGQMQALSDQLKERLDAGVMPG